MPKLADLEEVVEEILRVYEIDAPPIPVETMLQEPRDNMWEEVDVTQLSGSFLKMDNAYSPRMSLARLLARHITYSEFGAKHGLGALQDQEELTRAFARMLIMPRSMVDALGSGARTPAAMRLHFEVPQNDVKERLNDLANY